MKTVRLQLTTPAAGVYRVALLDHETAAELAHSELPAGEIDNAAWTPEKVQEFFASPEASQPNAKLQAIGQQLAQWLIRGAVKQALDGLRPNGLRVLLEVEPQRLASLPWELMRVGPIPNFLDVQSPFARFQVGAPSAKAEWPLRFLIVVGAAEADKTVEAEAEIEAIERELHPYGHSIDRDVLRRPSKTSLFERLREFHPHVLLFIGHCDTDPVVGAPVLRFQLAAPAKPWNWTPGDVAVDLNQLGWPSCLVILNACRTREPAASFQVSDAFMQSGALACIAMQGDVRGDLAGVFSAQVMRSLCDGEPLDVAVAKARGTVRQHTDLLQRDWAFPVLSLAVTPETLLPPRTACPARANLAAAFRDVTWFADRRDERRRFRSQLRLNPAGLPSTRPLLVTGPRQCGKSHLVRWCLEQFAIVYDGIVRYVPVSGSGSNDFVTVLRQIRDPSNGSGMFPEAALDAFHWKLNALLGGGVPTEWHGEAAADQNLRYDPQVAQAEHCIRDICKAFTDVLREAAKTHPVLIVMDRFTYNNTSLPVDAMKDALVPHLLRPLRESPNPGVTIVLVMDDAECERYGTNQFVPVDEWIRVPPDLPEPPERLAQELFWYPSRETLDEGLQLVIQAASKRLPPGAQPPVGYLKILKDTAVALLASEDNLRALLNVRQMR